MRSGTWLSVIAFHRLYNTDFCVIAKCKRALTSEKLATPDIFESDLVLHVGNPRFDGRFRVSQFDSAPLNFMARVRDRRSDGFNSAKWVRAPTHLLWMTLRRFRRLVPLVEENTISE